MPTNKKPRNLLLMCFRPIDSRITTLYSIFYIRSATGWGLFSSSRLYALNFTRVQLSYNLELAELVNMSLTCINQMLSSVIIIELIYSYFCLMRVRQNSSLTFSSKCHINHSSNFYTGGGIEIIQPQSIGRKVTPSTSESNHRDRGFQPVRD